MKNIYLFIAVLLSASFFSVSSAQNRFCDSSTRVSFLISPLEIPFGYETGYLEYKFSKRFSLGVETGHIFPDKLFDKIIYADDPLWVAYNGTVVKLNTKYFLKNSNGVYISLMATYKDLYYSWYPFLHSYKDYGFVTFRQSETAHLIGGNFIWGGRATVS